MSLLKHSVKDSLLVIQTVVNVAVPLALAAMEHAGLALILAPLQILMMLSCNNTSLHHHSHWETFTKKSVNRVYELFLSMAAATPLQVYRNAHLIHHKFVNDPPPSRDPISVLSLGQDGQPENLWQFCFKWTYRTNFVWIWITGAGQHMPLANLKALRRELIALAVFLVVLTLINPGYAAWWFFVICPAMQFANAAWHYGEHWGAGHHRGDTTRDSVGIYNAWYNTLCFNSGLHQEHHHRPGVHWTQLPSITQRLPSDRITAKGMHVFNAPWLADLQKLVKL